jgi:hypothetical protein
MNVPHTPAERPAHGRSAAPGDTRLHGRWLVLARLMWVALTILALGVFVATIPDRFSQLLDAAARVHEALAAFGLPDTFLAAYISAVDLIVVLAYSLIGAVIFWRRSDDWAAMFVSLVLTTSATMITRPDDSIVSVSPALHLPMVLVFAFVSASVVIFLYIFPDGRFVPRWTRWLAWIWGVGSLAWYLVPAVLNSAMPWPPSVPTLVILVGLATGLVAQIYRYVRVSSPSQRQQTKWVVAGLAALIQGALWFLFLAPALYPPFRQSGMARLFYILVGVPVFYFTMILVPVAIGISILRYRLWNIDVIINRTLVYGTLTGLLILVYVASVVLLERLLRPLTGQGTNDLAIVASTLAIAALFNPLRHRIQAFIDRRFYRSKYDATRTLAAFSATLRDEVDLDTLRAELTGVVEETMQPTHISLWLRPPDWPESSTREQDDDGH